MGTSFGCSDFWDPLGGQALVMIVQWYPKATLVRTKKKIVPTLPKIYGVVNDDNNFVK